MNILNRLFVELGLSGVRENKQGAVIMGTKT